MNLKFNIIASEAAENHVSLSKLTYGSVVPVLSLQFRENSTVQGFAVHGYSCVDSSWSCAKVLL